MPRVPRIVWILVLLALGFGAGLAYRRKYHPSFEERMTDAARDLENGMKDAAERLKR